MYFFRSQRITKHEQDIIFKNFEFIEHKFISKFSIDRFEIQYDRNIRIVKCVIAKTQFKTRIFFDFSSSTRIFTPRGGRIFPFACPLEIDLVDDNVDDLKFAT